MINECILLLSNMEFIFTLLMYIYRVFLLIILANFMSIKCKINIKYYMGRVKNEVVKVYFILNLTCLMFNFTYST